MNRRRQTQKQMVEPNTPIPAPTPEATPPWKSERPVTSRRTARLTFTVYGRTYEELNRRAGEEVERITGHNLIGWDVDIDARAAQKMGGEVVHYSADVTASRAENGGYLMPTTVFGDDHP